MVLSEFRLFGFQFISLYFGFYCIGYWLRKFKLQISSGYLLAFGITWFLLALFWRMHAVPTPFQWLEAFVPSSLITYGYRYITALVGSLFFVGFAMKFMNVKENIVVAFLSFCGKISLGIYIVHIFIGKYVYNLLMNYLYSDTDIAFIVLDCTIRLFLSIFIVLLIQRNFWISKVLLGTK